MKTRPLMVQIHLIVAALFLPFMLMMPLSGFLHLVDLEGGQSKNDVFVVDGVPPQDKAAMESFFRDEFKKNNIDFDFQYIKTTSTDFIFRPTSRVYYVATPVAGVLTMQKVDPSLSKRMMEIHKGHGPKFIRWMEIAFGIALLLVALSGVWIGIVTPIYRRPMLIAFAVGAVIMAMALI